VILAIDPGLLGFSIGPRTIRSHKIDRSPFIVTDDDVLPSNTSGSSGLLQVSSIPRGSATNQQLRNQALRKRLQAFTGPCGGSGVLIGPTHLGIASSLENARAPGGASHAQSCNMAD
jgi:hypothetical protein